MSDQDPGSGLDLALLVERLRLAGFRIDTRQYLAAHELLLAYAASGVRLEGDPQRLATSLGPIFCTSPEEQDRFAQEVMAWHGAPPPPPPPAPPPPIEKPFATWRHIRWWVPAGLGMLSIALVSALLYVRYYVPITVTGKVEVHQADGKVMDPAPLQGQLEFFVDGRPTALAADGTFAIPVTRARAVTVEARLDDYPSVVHKLTVSNNAAPAVLTLMPRVERESPAPALPGATPEAIGVTFSGQSTDIGIRWGLVAAAAAGTALVAFLGLWLAQQFRHRLALRQLPEQGDPESVTLAVPEIPVLPVAEPEMNRVALSRMIFCADAIFS